MPSWSEPRLIPRTPGILAFTIALREVREQHGVGVRALARKLDVRRASRDSRSRDCQRATCSDASWACSRRTGQSANS